MAFYSGIGEGVCLGLNILPTSVYVCYTIEFYHGYGLNVCKLHFFVSKTARQCGRVYKVDWFSVIQADSLWCTFLPCPTPCIHTHLGTRRAQSQWCRGHCTAQLICNLNEILKGIEEWNLQNEHLCREEEEKVKMKVDLGCHGMCVMVSLNISQLPLHQGSETCQCLQPAEGSSYFNRLWSPNRVSNQINWGNVLLLKWKEIKRAYDKFY